ncbi:MAG: hypothetical protein HY319_28545 [Armatimonadetes bacterium]|nr:hypothetical protein [Armatimonadota bacterium]
MFGVLVSVVLLTGTAGAQQMLRLQNEDVEIKTVEGRQVLRVEDVARVFPGVNTEGLEYIELQRLIDHPHARVTRRDGIITSVRFYNQSMGEIWDSVRRDQPAPTRSRTPNDMVPATVVTPPPTTPTDSSSTFLRGQEYTQRGDRKVYWEQTEPTSRKKSRVEMIREEVDQARD